MTCFLDVHTLPFCRPIVGIPYVISDQSDSDGHNNSLEQLSHGSGSRAIIDEGRLLTIINHPSNSR
jgi:hypothetical protein